MSEPSSLRAAASSAMSAGVAELQQLSPLLDQALDLPAPDRERWLAALPEPAQQLAPRLRELLRRHAAFETGDWIAAPLRPPVGLPAAGAQVGPYRLLTELGSGGMGTVWLAERADGLLARKVALKLPHLGWSSDLAERFAREREVLASLQHPHIARLYDVGVDALGRPYMALEYVQGEPITAFAERHALDIAGRLALLVQVAQALQHAHAHLVIHRDLKPANVLVSADGQAKLLDFGIAKLIDDEAAELTRTGAAALTPSYAAPEQLAGATISTATDVYALGLLLYELLTCSRPHPRSTRGELAWAVQHEEPLSPSRRGGPIATVSRSHAADLDIITQRALKKNPAERYASAAAFADELERWQRGEAILARGDSAWYRGRRFVERHRVAVVAAGLVLVSIGASTAIALHQAQIARTEAQVAAAVQDFLERIFRSNAADQDDPVRARLRTARELLDAGALRIDRELDGVPQAKLRVLQTMASMYRDMGEAEGAERLLTRMVELQARLQPAPDLERVRTLAALADMHLGAGHMAPAMQRLDEARTLAQALRGTDAAEANLAVQIVALSAARMRRDEAGIALATQILPLLEPRGPTPDLQFVWTALGGLQASSGQPERAVDALRRAVVVGEAIPGQAKTGMYDALMELAYAEMDLGHLAEAEAAMRRALAIQEERYGQESAVAMRVLSNVGALLAVSGRPREGLEIAQRVRQRPRGAPGQHAMADHDAAFEAHREALAWHRFGHPEKALNVLDDPATVRPGPTTGASLPIDWLLLRAAALADLGRFDAARSEIAAAEAQRAQRGTTSKRIVARIQRARLELELASGQPGAAAQAWADEPARTPQASAWLADRAELLLLRGQPDAAAAAAREAVAAMAARKPDVGAAVAAQRLQRILGAALLDIGQADVARAALAQAVALDEAIRDPTSSPERLRALALLGRAQLRLVDRAAAARSAASARALRARHAALGPQYQAALQSLLSELTPPQPRAQRPNERPLARPAAAHAHK